MKTGAVARPLGRASKSQRMPSLTVGLLPRFVREARAILVFLLLLSFFTSAATQPLFSTPVDSASPSYQTTHKLSREDERFLEDLEHRIFNYFWEQADPQTGLVPDRARMDGSALDEDHRNVASIAATGFGLTALCIAADHNWIKRNLARERARNALRFFANKAF